MKAERAEEVKQPKVLNSITLNMLDNGHVSVSGPIQDPVLVIDVVGKALNALTAYYMQEKMKDQRIVKPAPGLILPR